MTIKDIIVVFILGVVWPGIPLGLYLYVATYRGKRDSRR